MTLYKIREFLNKGRAEFKGLALLLLAPVCLGLVRSIWLVVAFSLHDSMILVDGLVMLLWGACVVFVMSKFACLGAGKIWTSFCVAAVGAVELGAVLLGTFAQGISLHFWGKLISREVLFTSIAGFTGLAKEAGFPAATGAVLIGACLLIGALCLLVMGSRPGAALAALGKKLPWSVWLVGSAGIFLVFYQGILSPAKLPWLRRDPFLRAFLFVQGDGMRYTDARTAAVKEDNKERKRVESLPAALGLARENVVLVILDAARPDHLSLYGYHRNTTPFLDSLAKEPESYRVPKAYSGATETLGGISTILASKNPRTLSVDALSLPEYFKDRGFKVALWNSGIFHWYGLERLFGKHPNLMDDGNQAADRLNDDWRLVEELERYPDSDGSPAFLYFHLMSTHDAGVARSDFVRWKPTASWTEMRFGGVGSFPLEGLTNDYDNRILQADAVVEKLWELLKRKGYLRNAAVAIVSDHGEMIGEHSAFSHGFFVYEENVRVPMMFWCEPAAKFKTGGLPGLIDVAPTLVDLSGLEIPRVWEGISMLRQTRDWVATEDLVHNRPRGAIYLNLDGHRYKYVRRLDANWIPTEEALHDMDLDPKEEGLPIFATPFMVAKTRAMAEKYLSSANAKPDGLRKGQP